MTHEQLRKFQKLDRQLRSLFKELSTLSATEPDGALNELKLEVVDRLLKEVGAFLGDELAPFPAPVELGKDAVHGDAVVVLGQYQACLDEYRARHTKQRYGQRHWVVETETDGQRSVEYVPETPSEPDS